MRLYFFFTCYFIATIHCSALTLEDAVKNLGAEAYKERNTAENFLWKQGLKAAKILRISVRSSDPEIATRARRILKKFEDGIFAHTSEENRQKLLEFSGLQKNRKYRYIENWFKEKKIDALESILFLYQKELKNGNKLSINFLFQDRNLIKTLIVNKSYQQLRILLRLKAVSGTVSPLINFVQTLKLTKDELNYQKQLYESNPSANSAKVLISLLIYTGDQKKALELIKKHGLYGSFKYELLMNGHYQLLLDNLPMQDLEKLGWQMTLARFSKNRKKYNEAKTEISKVPKKGNTWYHIQLFLINQEYEQAFSYSKKHSPEQYLKLLIAQRNYTQCHAYLEKNGSPKNILSYINNLNRSNDKLVAKKWLIRIDYPSLDDSTKKQFLKKAAHFLTTQEKFTFLTKYLKNHAFNQDLFSLSRYSSYLKKWWPALEEKDLAKRFYTLCSFFEKESSEEETERILKLGEKKLKAAVVTSARRVVQRIAQAEIRKKSLYDEILEFYQQKKWSKALDKLLEVQANKATFFSLYNQALCLKQLGKTKEAKERFITARLQLSSLSEKYQLITFLNKSGFENIAAEEALYVINIYSAENAYYHSEFLKLTIDHWLKLKQFDKAKRHWQVTIFRYLKFSKSAYSSSFFIANNYLAYIDLSQALEKRDVKTAMDICRTRIEFTVANTKFPARIIHLFKTHGFTKEAALLPAIVMKKIDQFLKAPTDIASLLNFWSWNAALLNYKLDLAEKRMLKSLRIAPEIGNHWDTLAEVYARQGRYKKAAEAMTAAVKFTPRKDFEERLKLFKEKAGK
ncbi:MAG: hypothetical protein HRT89_06045 [Lentisphaeria bacterium]|nr:hypothetical protein [Lentisphaeria bacterium]NQZ67614.1 hypothetical protein [Lentisphaeria bacterium]